MFKFIKSHLRAHPRKPSAPAPPPPPNSPVKFANPRRRDRPSTAHAHRRPSTPPKRPTEDLGSLIEYYQHLIDINLSTPQDEHVLGMLLELQMRRKAMARMERESTVDFGGLEKLTTLLEAREWERK